MQPSAERHPAVAAGAESADAMDSPANHASDFFANNPQPSSKSIYLFRSIATTTAVCATASEISDDPQTATNTASCDGRMPALVISFVESLERSNDPSKRCKPMSVCIPLPPSNATALEWTSTLNGSATPFVSSVPARWWARRAVRNASDDGVSPAGKSSLAKDISNNVVLDEVAIEPGCCDGRAVSMQLCESWTVSDSETWSSPASFVFGGASSVSLVVPPLMSGPLAVYTAAGLLFFFFLPSPVSIARQDIVADCWLGRQTPPLRKTGSKGATSPPFTPIPIQASGRPSSLLELVRVEASGGKAAPRPVMRAALRIETFGASGSLAPPILGSMSAPKESHGFESSAAPEPRKS
mmetsp:Transcript_123735/g.193192  ORF Transcript_123735/g.193192 Transcript_123735/m.193192 type:complete len:355 (+) Transcript_123735:110-1174(+)